MKRFFGISLALWILGAPYGAAEDMKMAIYYLPPSYFFQPTKPSEPDTRIPVDGVKRLEVSPFYGETEVYDVRQYLEAQNVLFPEPAEALFLAKRGILFLRNTVENFQLIESLSGCCSAGLPPLLRNEFSVVQFKLKSPPLAEKPLTFPEVFKAAGNTWKVVSTAEVIVQTGLMGEFVSSTGQVPASHPRGNDLKCREMGPNDAGISCAIEPTAGPDGYGINATISFRYQSPNDESGKKTTLVFEGSTLLFDRQPQILQYSVTGPENTGYAIVLRSSLALPNLLPTSEESNPPGPQTR